MDGSSRYVVAANGGTLTFDNGTNGPAVLTGFASSAGDTITAPTILNSGLIVANNSPQTLTLAGGIAGANGLTLVGPGTVALGAANSYSGGTIISNGTLRTLVPGSTSTGLVTLAGGTLSLTGSGGVSLGNTVNVAAASSLIASNVPTLAGPLFGSNATLNILVPNGQTFDWNCSVSNRFSGTIAFGNSPGFVRFRISELLLNAAFDLGTNALTINPRDVPLTVSFGSMAGGPNTTLAGCSVSGSSTAASRYTVGFNNLSTTFAGRMVDGASGNNRFLAITKVGTGTWTLTGNNTYSGGTTISNGTVQIGNGGTTGTLGVSNVVNLGTLIFNRSNATNFSGVISGSGSLIQLGSGALTLTRSNTYTGGTIVSNGTLFVNNAIGSGTGTGSVTCSAAARSAAPESSVAR